MKEKKEIPLSLYAGNKISENFSKCFGAATVFTGIGFVVALMWMGGANPNVGKPFIWWIGLSLMSWLISAAIKGKEWFKTRQNILSQNRADYERCLKLKRVLEEFSSVDVSKFSVPEEKIGDSLKPFRVEHFISSSLRGEIVGEVTLHGNILFGGTLRGPMEGAVKGMAIPNLLDSSSILFLKDSNGTLRVLIPSPRATRELLVKTIELWLSDTPKNSHTYTVLREFSVTDEYLLNPISHPQFIDLLDASCEMSVNERPNVGVIGEKIQEGVVLATALEANGKQAVFLPSGFFSELSAHVIPFIEQVREPKMLSAVQEV